MIFSKNDNTLIADSFKGFNFDYVYVKDGNSYNYSRGALNMSGNNNESKSFICKQVVIIPEYLTHYFRKNDESIVNIVSSMPRLDKSDYEFWEDFYYHILLETMVVDFENDSESLLFTPINKPMLFETFIDRLYKSIVYKKDFGVGFNNINSKDDLREVFRSLYVTSGEDNYSKIDNINMSIKTNGYKNVEKFFDVEINNLGIIITLKRGFTNLCLKNSLCTILVFFERLFNCLIRQYGESIIIHDDDISKARVTYLKILRYVSLQE